MSSRAVGLLIGFAADRALGDPARLHPVAGFGSAASRLEERLYADDRMRGALYTATLVGGVTAVGIGAEHLTRHRPLGRIALTALATWSVLGGRSLEREASVIAGMLEADDLSAARQRLTHLVARETRSLGPSEIARAVVESVAENTSDAVIAPLMWGAIAGVPGLLGYRAANTLDAMVGYRSDRYRRFGWASARLDDVLNLPAARIGGVLVGLAAPERALESWRIWARDASSHPSPNAGVVEAAFAGSLQLRLGGTNTYHGVVEDRAGLGDGAEVRPADVPRAVGLARRVGLAAALLATGIAWSRRSERGW